MTEGDAPGSRSLFIHWAQELFDQAGLVREMVKWDYELRNAAQMETVVDRALSLAMSSPRGPVYLTLPREVLAEPIGEHGTITPNRVQPSPPPVPDANTIDQAASWLAGASNPLIIASSYGQQTDAVPVLADFAERFAIPVVSYRPRYICLPNNHAMHAGYEPGPYIKDVDVILTLDSDVPWIPSLHKVNPDAKIIQVAVDPLYSTYPIRGFPCDLAIAGSSSTTVALLGDAIAGTKQNQAACDARRKRIAEVQQAGREGRAAKIAQCGTGAPMEAAWVAHCMNQVRGPGDVVVSESQIPHGFFDYTEPGSLFSTSPAGGLGWGVGAALGVKLGARDRRVFSIVGDGSYMFGNPTPSHYVGAANDLPVLTVILNNRMWGSVRKATLGLYPDGAAAKLNRAPLTTLEPTPDYEKIVTASGGYGEKVDAAEDLPAALERALKAVEVEKRQAVLNVQTIYDDSMALADARR